MRADSVRMPPAVLNPGVNHSEEFWLRHKIVETQELLGE